ncbi:hypothetical protein HY501_01335 [Candidatus Woesearchaeota archaeon]|nr:hypothetical protein [Candidatus Woesearchaeota archaeon]
MMSLQGIFVVVTFLFFMFLLLKDAAGKKVRSCPLCAAIFLTWASLLILWKLNRFTDSVILALLLGESIAGIYHLVEKKASDNLLFFRLPFLLTLTLLGYVLISGFAGIATTAGLLVLLWAIFLAIFGYKQKAAFRSLVDKVIACCKE